MATNYLMSRYSERERFDFGLWFLRECSKELNQHLLIVPGYELASESMNKHLENSALAFTNNISGILKNVDLHEKLALEEALGNHFITGGKEEISLSKNQFKLRTRFCAYHGYAPTLCEGVCTHGSRIIADENMPGCSFENRVALIMGEDYCSWWCQFDSNEMSNSIDMIKKFDHDNIIGRISIEEYEWMSRNVCGEIWLITNRVLLEHVSKELLMKQLKTRLCNLGIHLANKLAFENQLKIGGVDVSSNIIDFINMTQNQSGSIVNHTDSYVEKEIKECPFSGNNECICEEFEIIFNGICNILSPGYEFKYLQTMPQGASSCRWCIKRKDRVVRS